MDINTLWPSLLIMGLIAGVGWKASNYLNNMSKELRAFVKAETRDLKSEIKDLRDKLSKIEKEGGNEYATKIDLRNEIARLEETVDKLETRVETDFKSIREQTAAQFMEVRNSVMKVVHYLRSPK